MAATPHPFISPEEYLALERVALTKSEYLGGRIYTMPGASPRHNIIVGNVYASLHAQLKRRGCIVYPSDMRVKVPATGLYTYPDISVVCGSSHFDEDRQPESLTNPTLLIEVLSPSTEAYDRGQKFAHYRKLPTLREYLLIAQESIHIEHYTRQADDQWLLTERDEPDATLTLASIECRLSLTDVYEKVEWDEPSD